jgi:hypothetical protein
MTSENRPFSLPTSEPRTVVLEGELPARTTPAKREFLADATAFANTGGGLLLYGIPRDPTD